MSSAEGNREVAPLKSREIKCGAATLALFVPLELTKSKNESQHVYQVKGLPVNIRPLSLAKTSGIISLPLETQKRAIEKQSGEIAALAASKRKTTHKDTRPLPDSLLCILDGSRNSTGKAYRADVIVPLTHFEPKTDQQQMVRKSCTSDCEALLNAVSQSSNTKVKGSESCTTGGMLQSIFKGIDDILHQERERCEDRPPFRALFQTLYHAAQTKDTSIDLYKDGMFFDGIFPASLIKVLRFSHSDYLRNLGSQEIESSLTIADIPLAARLVHGTYLEDIDDFISIEQSANALSCIALIEFLCPVFISLVDGNSRIHSILMQLTGMAQRNSASSNDMILNPFTAKVKVGLFPTTVRVNLLTSARHDGVDKEVDFANSIRACLTLSSKIATSTKQTMTLQEPEHL